MRARLSSLGIGGGLRQALGVKLGRFRQYPPRRLSVSTIGAGENDCDGLPSIAIVTPSFNQARYVGQTLQSVVTQNYPRLHYIVQDAGSSDGTREILDRYALLGVEVHVEADAGQADALNRGFARSSGEIMAYLNSDDLMLPGTLLYVGRYFRDNPSVDVVYGNRLVVDEEGREIGRWILPGHDKDVLRLVDYVPQESLFWRRSTWERIGGEFDAAVHFAMDWDLILRCMSVGAEFRHLPELFAAFRVHGDQKTQVDYLSRGAAEMRQLRSRYGHVGLGRRIALHWNYLSRHRRADAAFEAALRKNG